MWQFSLRRLFISVALVAIGLGALAAGDTTSSRPDGNAMLVLWLSGGSLMMAGIFNIFRHPIIGAMLGLVIQLILLTLLGERIVGLN
jgi:hypothetical protein